MKIAKSWTVLRKRTNRLHWLKFRGPALITGALLVSLDRVCRWWGIGEVSGPPWGTGHRMDSWEPQSFLQVNRVGVAALPHWAFSTFYFLIPIIISKNPLPSSQPIKWQNPQCSPGAPRKIAVHPKQDHKWPQGRGWATLGHPVLHMCRTWYGPLMEFELKFFIPI